MLRSMVCLAALTTLLHAQGGIPFPFTLPNINIHSGYRLNFHDNFSGGLPVQDLGELLPNQFGSGNATNGIVASMISLNVYYPAGTATWGTTTLPNNSGTAINPTQPYDLQYGLLNGQSYWVVKPTVTPTGANASTAIIVLPPTRAVAGKIPTGTGWTAIHVNDHTPNPEVQSTHVPPSATTLAQWYPGYWLECSLVEGDFAKGIGAIAMTSDTVGGHPFEFTIQQSCALSLHLRNLGFKKIVLSGGSYGAAAGYMAAVLCPQYFDGFIGAGTGFGYRSYERELQVLSLRERSKGPSARSAAQHGASIQPDQDPIYAIGAQFGYSIDAIDLLTYPHNYRIPMTIVNGAEDYIVPSREFLPYVEGFITPPWNTSMLDVTIVREAGHGDSRVAAAITDPDPITGISRYDALLATVAAATAKTLPIPSSLPPIAPPGTPAFPVVPPTYYAGFDDLMRYDRNAIPNPSPDPCPELWRMDRDGNGLGTTGELVKSSGNVAYYANLEGYVTCRSFLASSSTVTWRTFTGLDPHSVYLWDNGAGPFRVFVGTTRGFHVLDAATGGIIREKVGTDRTDIRAITCGTINGWTLTNGATIGNSAVCAYITHGSRLVIEDAYSGFEHLNNDIGGCAKLEFRDFNGKTYLYAALSRGHIARFGFENDPQNAGKARVFADMVSEDLEMQPRDFEFVTAGGTEKIAVVGGYQNLSTNAGDTWLAVLVASTGVHATFSAPLPGQYSLAIAGTNGKITVPWGGPNKQVEKSVNAGCVIVGFNNVVIGPYIMEVDIATGSVTSNYFQSFEGINFVASSIGGVGVVLRFNDQGRVDVVNYTTVPSTGPGVPSIGPGSLVGSSVDSYYATTAVDTHLNMSNSGGSSPRWEVSVLDRDWTIRRYRVFAEGTTFPAGSEINPPPAPPTVYPKSTPTQSFPTRLERTSDGATAADYEIFEHDGEIWTTSNSPSGFLRLSCKFNGISGTLTKNTGIAVSAHKSDEHDYLMGIHPDEESESTGISTMLTTSPIYTYPGSSTVLAEFYPFMDPQLLVTDDTAIAAAPLTTPVTYSGVTIPSHYALVSQGGILRLLDNGTKLISTEVALGSHDHSALEVVDVDGDGVDDIVTGALFKNGNGRSFFIIYGASLLANPSSPTITSADFGRISGLRVIDFDNDGSKEFVIGEANGRLSIYDRNLTQIYSVDDRYLATGSFDTIWFIPAGSTAEAVYPTLVYTTSGGIVVRELIGL